MKQYLLISSIILTGFQAIAQNESTASAEMPGVIDVIGEAEVKLQPDYFSINIVVEHEAVSPEKAQQAVMQESEDVLAFLRETEEIEKVQTQHIELRSQVRDYQKGEKTFHARQVIRFELTAPGTYDEVMVTLLQRGIDGISNVEFRSSEEEKYKQILLRQAVMNAREKAELLAEQLGQELGKATYISDRIGRGPEPRPAEMYKSGLRVSSSLEPGEITLSATVNVQFKLD